VFVIDIYSVWSFVNEHVNGYSVPYVKS
jgi:hypothetical protein